MSPPPNSGTADNVDKEEDVVDEQGSSEPQTWGYMEVVDGELVFGDADSLELGIDEWMSQLEDQTMHIDEA
jgi:hypothetical protein